MRQFWADFKKFALKGNVFDLAVGVIIGGAFGKIVSSLVADLITPLFGIILGGVDFKGLSVTIGESVIQYGNFIQNVVDFLIISLTIFSFIKLVSRLTHREEKEEPKPPEKSEEVLLLEEIRDLLKEGQAVPAAAELLQTAEEPEAPEASKDEK